LHNQKHFSWYFLPRSLLRLRTSPVCLSPSWATTVQPFASLSSQHSTSFILFHLHLLLLLLFISPLGFSFGLLSSPSFILVPCPRLIPSHPRYKCHGGGSRQERNSWIEFLATRVVRFALLLPCSLFSFSPLLTLPLLLLTVTLPFYAGDCLRHSNTDLHSSLLNSREHTRSI
jgi:hypothetical protein